MNRGKWLVVVVVLALAAAIGLWMTRSPGADRASVETAATGAAETSEPAPEATGGDGAAQAASRESDAEPGEAPTAEAGTEADEALAAAPESGEYEAPAGEAGEPTPVPTGEEPSNEPAAEPTVTASPTAVPLEYLFDITVHPPSCVANGYSIYVSKESGSIDVRDEVPRLKHDWVEVDGELVCSMCGRKKGNEEGY